MQGVRDAAVAERVKLQNTPPLQLQLQARLLNFYILIAPALIFSIF